MFFAIPVASVLFMFFSLRVFQLRPIRLVENRAPIGWRSRGVDDFCAPETLGIENFFPPAPGRDGFLQHTELQVPVGRRNTSRRTTHDAARRLLKNGTHASLDPATLRAYQQTRVGRRDCAAKFARLEDLAVAAKMDLRVKGLAFEFFLHHFIPSSLRDGFALNVGGNDGISHDPIYPLFKRWNYQGVVVEAFEGFREVLFRNLGPVNHTGRVFPVIGAFPPQEWPRLLEQWGYPKGFDALKIDVDGGRNRTSDGQTLLEQCPEG